MSVHALSPAHGKRNNAAVLLFAGISFAISPTLARDVAANVSELLSANGATKAPMDTAAFVISNTGAFDRMKPIREDAQIVTPYWVERSAALDNLQSPKGFSADPRMIFSGVVASSVELPDGDKEIMRASITALGGQWREMLTRDVTHLFCLTNKTEKYAMAIALSQMRVLLPHWLEDSLNARHLVPYDVYVFPLPKLLAIHSGIHDQHEATTYQIDATKELLFRTALLAADESEDVFDHHTHPAVNVWQNRRVYLSRSVSLGQGRRNAVETMLKSGGARVVPFDDRDELELRAVSECDVFVSRYREGQAFERALRDEKIIGTLAWVLYVHHRGMYTSPFDQLLHFPFPSKPVPCIESLNISVTNYTGSARQYLAQLIAVMGGHSTSTLSQDNTHVVTASLTGKKTTKAREWRVPIVNHLWLEDCFLAWELVPPAHEKYTRFPHHDDIAVIMAESGIGKYTLEEHDATMKLLPPAQAKTPRLQRQRDMHFEWDTVHDTDNPEWPSPVEEVPPTSVHLGSFESKNPSPSAAKRPFSVLAADDEEEPPRKRLHTGHVKTRTFAKKRLDTVTESSFEDDADEDVSRRRRSGRAAAAKATKTLKDIVMPDLLRFEKHEKRGRKNTSEETAPPKLNTNANSKARPILLQPLATRTRGAPIRYMTTGVKLTDSAAEVLASLGARPTTEAGQCTHLIADRVVRTEKFLLAMHYAPLVVTVAWADACVAAKVLVSEGPYVLSDPASEGKHNVKLADALGRARAKRGILFQDCIFYVTLSDGADHALIEALVMAGGGKLKWDLPNLRQAQQERTFIVSHKQNREKWKSLADRGIPIYNSNFILNGALRQQLPIDDPTARLSDSSRGALSDGAARTR